MSPARALIVLQGSAPLVPLARGDQRPGLAVVATVMAGSLGADVGIDGVRDGAVGAACLVLAPPRRCPAPAGRRHRPQRSRSARRTDSRAVLRSPGSLSPRLSGPGETDQEQSRHRAPGRLNPGKTSAPIRRTGELPKVASLRWYDSYT
jgi:hypothetical protein